MAMIDYGAIAFKNGELISTGMFTPMKDTCGFSDRDNKLPGMGEQLDGNQFVVIGNEDIVFGFYKSYMTYWSKGSISTEDCYVSFNRKYPYYKWKKYEDMIPYKQGWADIVVKPKNGYFVANIKIGEDKYKVYFGYGVDFNFYKKTKRVNYYRSPEFFVKRIRFEITHKIKMWKIRREK